MKEVSLNSGLLDPFKTYLYSACFFMLISIEKFYLLHKTTSTGGNLNGKS